MHLEQLSLGEDKHRGHQSGGHHGGGQPPPAGPRSAGAYRHRHRMHRQHQHQEHVEHRGGGGQHRVAQPPGPATAPQRHQAIHRQPHGRGHRQRIRPGFGPRPGDPGQHGEQHPGGHRHSPAGQLPTEQHDPGRRRTDSQRTGQPGGELGRREHREPAVHKQVVQAVHGIDVEHHPPQFRHGTGAGRQRGRLVEPQRRPSRAGGADHRREQCHR